MLPMFGILSAKMIGGTDLPQSRCDRRHRLIPVEKRAARQEQRLDDASEELEIVTWNLYPRLSPATASRLRLFQIEHLPIGAIAHVLEDLQVHLLTKKVNASIS